LDSGAGGAGGGKVIEKGGTDDGGRVRRRGDEVGYILGCKEEEEGVFLFLFVLFSKSF
jgi:hypothetical protein